KGALGQFEQSLAGPPPEYHRHPHRKRQLLPTVISPLPKHVIPDPQVVWVCREVLFKRRTLARIRRADCQPTSWAGSGALAFEDEPVPRHISDRYATP